VKEAAHSLLRGKSRLIRRLSTTSLPQTRIFVAEIGCCLTRVALAHAIADASRARTIQAERDCLPVRADLVSRRTIAAFRNSISRWNQVDQDNRADSNRKSKSFHPHPLINDIPF